ncbi:MAG: hypothetical protein Q8O94_02270 [bacterium]|nr:hypothetical protein [bacterium]
MSANTATPVVKKFRNWTMWMILAAGGAVVLIVITHQMATYKSKPSEKAMASTQSAQAGIPLVSELSVAERPKLTMPPVVGGKSERVQYTPDMAGMHIVVDGNNFLLHTVYQDGTECAFGEQCDTTKPQAGAYVTNKVRETNVVSYAFVQD